MSQSDEALTSLSECELFRGLSKRTLRSLASSSRLVEHQAGKEVVEEGGTPYGFHLILDGTAEVYVHGEQRRSLHVGDHFGIVSLLDGKPRSATVRAASPLRTLSITPWVFGPLLDQEPTIARELLPVLCGLLRSAEERPASTTT